MLIYDIEAFIRMQLEDDPYDKNTYHYGKVELIELIKFLFEVDLPSYWLSGELKHIEGFQRLTEQFRAYNVKPMPPEGYIVKPAKGKDGIYEVVDGPCAGKQIKLK